MTTRTTSTRLRHDSDATFREWGLEFSTSLSTIGLTQTADTGQINWTTVTRPAANTQAGYEIWRFNDSNQSTAPIFLKIGYGTHSVANAPRIQIQFGTGSDGAGNLTGTTSALANFCGSTAQAGDTVRQSFWCYTEGFFGVMWKAGSNSEGFFCVCRTASISSGAPDDRGAFLRWGSSISNNLTAAQHMLLTGTGAPAAQPTRISMATSIQCLAALTPDTGVVGGDMQVFLAYTTGLRQEPLFGLCGVIRDDAAQLSTVNLTLFGSTARTFLVCHQNAGSLNGISAGSSGGMHPCILYE